MGLKSWLIGMYDKHYKPLMILTFVLLVVALVVLGVHKATTGEFVTTGVSLKGGITLTIPVQEEHDVNALQQTLARQFPKADIHVRGLSEAGTQVAVLVEASDVDETLILDGARSAGFPLEQGSYTIESMGSALGGSFFRQTVRALILAFIFMAIVVFITFRQLVPSAFVILAAFSDIICTLAVVALLDIRLSTAGIAAFLMLIGYSVDTDILLTTRVLRRQEGSILDRTLNAMRTGMLMSLTSFAATVIGYVFTQSDTIKQIMLILSIGLVFDMLNTWVQNAGILRWYLEWKEKKKEAQAAEYNN